MSKIVALIVIPIAYLGVKRLQEEFPNEQPQDIKPLIPTTVKTVDDTQVRPHDRFGL